MIEQALYEHLMAQDVLKSLLAYYDGGAAVFNQKAPSDVDALWEDGPQYPRVVFAEDMQDDSERAMGGTLSIDVMCKDGAEFESGFDTRMKMVLPEDLEPLVRGFIDGYFFSRGTFTVAAQWKNSSYFTDPTEHVIGVTMAFELLAFPIITTDNPDIVSRFNAWSADIDGLVVINHDELPATAWRPDDETSAIYWRVIQDKECTWIPSTFQTLMRTALVRCHIFSKDMATAARVARDLTVRLHSQKRLLKDGETPIMVNRDNVIENGADPLRTGQLTVDATYAIIIYHGNPNTIDDINVKDGGNTQ